MAPAPSVVSRAAATFSRPLRVVGEFETRMKDYATNAAFRDKMKGYTDLYVTGSREILQIT